MLNVLLLVVSDLISKNSILINHVMYSLIVNIVMIVAIGIINYIKNNLKSKNIDEFKDCFNRWLKSKA